MDTEAELARYRAELEGLGLARWADALVAGTELSVRLVPDEQASTEVVGRSRLGGRPISRPARPGPGARTVRH